MLAMKRAVSLFTCAAIVLVSTLLIAGRDSKTRSVDNRSWKATVNATGWNIIYDNLFTVTNSTHTFSVKNKTNKKADFHFTYAQRVLVKNDVGNFVDVPGDDLFRHVSGSFTVLPDQTFTSDDLADSEPRYNGYFTQDFFGEEGKEYRLKATTIIQPPRKFGHALDPIARVEWRNN